MMSKRFFQHFHLYKQLKCKPKQWNNCSDIIELGSSLLTAILYKDQPGYIGGWARMVSDLDETCTICTDIQAMKKNQENP